MADLNVHMNVPLFPRPPTAVGGVTTPLSDVPDVATLLRAPTSVSHILRERYVAPSSVRSPPGVRKGRRVFRNLIHPRIKDAALIKDAARRRVMEFRVKMKTEDRGKNNEANDDDDDDDNDVVCSVGG